jgi:hypothetical protein
VSFSWGLSLGDEKDYTSDSHLCKREHINKRRRSEKDYTSDSHLCKREHINKRRRSEKDYTSDSHLCKREHINKRRRSEKDYTSDSTLSEFICVRENTLIRGGVAPLEGCTPATAH